MTPVKTRADGFSVDGHVLTAAPLSDEDVQALSDAIWTHKVVVVKGQQSLAPTKQWELVRRFDPTAEDVHSHGEIKSFNKPNNILSVSIVPPSPDFCSLWGSQYLRRKIPY